MHIALLTCLCGHARSQSGATALILASVQGNPFTVKVLLANGANKSAKNKVGNEGMGMTGGAGPFAWDSIGLRTGLRGQGKEDRVAGDRQGLGGQGCGWTRPGGGIRLGCV